MLRDFLKPGTEYQKVAEILNAINISLEELILNANNSEYSKDELIEYTLLNAYLYKKGVEERIDVYNWPLETQIIIPSISNEVSTLFVATMTIQHKLFLLADSESLGEKIAEIMDKGPLFYEVENKIPDQQKHII